MRGNAIILNTIAKTLNAGGSAIVAAYDAGAGAFNTTMTALSPGEKSQLRSRIKACEKKIQSLYGEIGKVTSKFIDPAAALESEAAAAIIGSIRELSNEIETMKRRLVELETVKAESIKQKPKSTPVDSTSVSTFFFKSISNSIASYLPGERRTLEQRIAEHERKIQALYGDFAKESAKYPDPADALTAEPIKEIIARINEQKGEVEALKTQIVELTMVKKAEKAETVAATVHDAVVSDTPTDESPASAPKSADTVADAAAEVAVQLKSAVVEVPEEEQVSVQVEASIASNESPAIGYSRSKPCLIPSPSLQPPTRVDIENATRNLQVEKAETAVAKEALKTAEDEQQKDAEGPDTDAEELLVTEIVPVSDEISAVLDEETESSDAEVVAEAASEKEEAVVAAVDDEESAELHELSEVPEESGSDGPVEEQSEDNEKLDRYDAIEKELEKKKEITDHNEGAVKESWRTVITAPHSFASLRTRSLSGPFVASTETVSQFSTPADEQEKKRERVFSDDTAPVFRTRVHQNIFAKGVAASENEPVVEFAAPNVKRPVVEVSAPVVEEPVVETLAPSPLAEMVASLRKVARSEKKIVKKSDIPSSKTATLSAKKPDSKATKPELGKRPKK
jgi:hypothetical protein